MVPKTGLEPVRSFGTKDFKSFASANSATSAKVLNKNLLSTVLEAPTRIELVMEILQTSALPLGYGAVIRAAKNNNSFIKF